MLVCWISRRISCLLCLFVGSAEELAVCCAYHPMLSIVRSAQELAIHGNTCFYCLMLLIVRSTQELAVCCAYHPMLLIVRSTQELAVSCFYCLMLLIVRSTQELAVCSANCHMLLIVRSAQELADFFTPCTWLLFDRSTQGVRWVWRAGDPRQSIRCGCVWSGFGSSQQQWPCLSQQTFLHLLWVFAMAILIYCECL